jgi:hypothetical protein
MYQKRFAFSSGTHVKVVHPSLHCVIARVFPSAIQINIAFYWMAPGEYPRNDGMRAVLVLRTIHCLLIIVH